MPKENYFRRFLTKEDLLHEACLNKGKAKYPGIPFIHCPMEGKRSIAEQYKFKILGAESGVSDVLFTGSSGNHKGLWIELKCGTNKLTQSQYAFLLKMKAQGYAVGVVYDNVEDFINMLQVYHVGPAYFNPGIVLAYGELQRMDSEEFEKRFVKKSSTKTSKKKAGKSFEEKARSKFGKPLKGVKLPNSGKLFQSPK